MQEIHFDTKSVRANEKHLALESFAKLVLKWSKIHNITGAKDIDSIWKEIYDSTLATLILKPFSVCVDIGSGAGFPAIVLSVFYPNSRFYLLEPRIKRVSFLQNTIAELKLENVEVIADFSYNIHNIKGDLITSRAVCNAKKLIQDSSHLLQNNGFYLLFKGEKSVNEYKELQDFDINIFKHKRRFFIYAKCE